MELDAPTPLWGSWAPGFIQAEKVHTDLKSSVINTCPASSIYFSMITC